VSLTYDTITYEPPRRVQFRGRNKGSTVTDSLTLTAADAGTTEVHYRADFTFHGWVRHVAPLVVRRPRLEALADETVAQLTAAIESAEGPA
jgi:hypothetical protein